MEELFDAMVEVLVVRLMCARCLLKLCIQVRAGKWYRRLDGADCSCEVWAFVEEFDGICLARV